jgi:type I restriction enzyme, S subunit
MSLPKYPKYKDSGISWVGPIPSHWEVRRTKFLFDLMRRPVRPDDEIVTAFRDGEVTLRINRRVDGFTNAVQEIGYQGVRAGDLVIHAMDAFAGAIGVSDSEGKSTPVYSVCQPRTGIAESLYYGKLLRHMALSGFINALAKGIRERSTEFRWTDAGGVLLPLPSLDEQREIVNFIDREAGKIDALVEEQRGLIELLKEKRQAVISHAVTKGVNPDTPTKDSSVEWLGRIPAHWGAQRISTLSTKITNGYVGPTRDVLVASGVRYLQSLHIKGNGIRFDDPYYVREDWSNAHEKSSLRRGDVLIVQTGDIGQAAAVDDEFVGCNCHALIIVSPKQDVVTGEWISWVLASDYGLHTLLSIQTGALHPHLNCGDVKDIFIPIPPKGEQC